MDALTVLKKIADKKLPDYPEIVYSNLYKRVLDNAHFEFKVEEEGCLFSPLYTLLLGDPGPELLEFVSNNEEFLNFLKVYIINSLFVYSALVEENSYYLTKPQSVVIIRLIHKEEYKFEIKFYTHYQEELLDTYNDKIYIGRDFLDLEQFERKYLGLEENFTSLIEQNDKIQDRAKHKLRYLEDFQKPYLNEINYLINETVSDALERIKLFPESMVAKIPKIKLNDTLDNIHYIQNLMVELHDFLNEFEGKLRAREEHKFVRYLTKFSKDIKADIRYLLKLSFQMHMKISNCRIC
ncbi:MAG: hypothetical protein KAW12_11745 [Candidatus Aminicenantes bacterium]|nr:hypothetical protein [Candidatus Aminicenantes bacterium]